MFAPMLQPPVVDVTALRAYRLGRVRSQLAAHDVALAILTNPASLRYAVDWREYAMFQSRIPTYYLFVPADGAVVMHGAYGAEHPAIDEFRPADYLNVFDGGLDTAATAGRFAAEVRDLVGAGAKVAVERLQPSAVRALQAEGVTVVDAEPFVERGRAIKSAEEITCMRHSIAVAETGMAVMREALRPGITENQLWAKLHQVNIANDGDWIDGRMLSSGPRTNPWYQEASDRLIQDGELVAFDTDMIGPFGYCADISRTWLVGEGRPTTVQQDRYRRAHAEITHNAALLGPGLSLREFSEKAYRHDDEFIAHRYACLAHGVGMTDEYPKVYYRQDWARHGYDGVIEPNMVLTVESFVGSDRGGPGVKLEQMYLVGEQEVELLSTYPLEERLLG